MFTFMKKINENKANVQITADAIGRCRQGVCGVFLQAHGEHALLVDLPSERPVSAAPSETQHKHI